MSCILYTKASYTAMAQTETFRELWQSVAASHFYTPACFADALFELNAKAYQDRYGHGEELTEEIQAARDDSETDFELDELAKAEAEGKRGATFEALHSTLRRIRYQCSDANDFETDETALLLEAAIEWAEPKAKEFALTDARAASLAREQERAAAIERGRALLDAERPAWAKAAIIAELEQDECDTQTDYFATSTKRVVVLAWSKHTRDLFAEMRKAAATFPETAHLGPGRGLFKPRIVLACDVTSNGASYWKGSPSHWHSELANGETFTTRAEAEAFIASKGEPGPINFSTTGGDSQLVTFEWEILEGEVEHREKYSMGAGYYLKAGGSYSSGWAVSKVEFYDGQIPTRLYEAAGIEGGYQVPSAKPKAAPSMESAGAVLGVPSYTGAAGGQCVVSRQGDWTWIKFEAKPSKSILLSLKAAGARWSKRREAWYLAAPVDVEIDGDSLRLTPKDEAGRAPVRSESDPAEASGTGVAVLAEASTGESAHPETVATCDVCGRGFDEPDFLAAHKMIAHDPELTFKHLLSGVEKTVIGNGDFSTTYTATTEQYRRLSAAFERWEESPNPPSAWAVGRASRIMRQTRIVDPKPSGEPDDTPPTGTDGGGTNGPQEGGAAAHAGEREGVPAGEQAVGLYASADTLKALKVLKDAENVRVKRDGCEAPHGCPSRALLRLAGRDIIVDVDKLARWVSYLPKDAERIAVEFEGVGGDYFASLALTAGGSYIRIRAQSFPLSHTPIELTVSGSGEMLAPALPDKASMKIARADLAQSRKTEKLRKEALKAHEAAGAARRRLQDERDRFNRAQGVMTSTTYAEALNLAVGVREARRELRRLQLVTGEAKIVGRRRGRRSGTIYHLVRGMRESALDAFAWTTTEQRALYAEQFKAYARRRTPESKAGQVAHTSRAVADMFYLYVSETFGAEFAEAVKWRRPSEFRAARKVVKAYPAKRAELELTYREAEDRYLDAFDTYERAEARAA